MPRTDVSGSGLWRTPQAQEAGARVETLYTKNGQPAKIGERAYRKQPDGRMVLQSVTINQQVKMWPTPRTPTGGRTVKPRQDGHRSNLEEELAERQPELIGGSLNPTWVEWLMGYPIGYTALEHWATPSSLKLRKQSPG
jgi:hypothetical protein